MSTDLASPAQTVLALIIIGLLLLIVKRVKGFSMKELGSWFFGKLFVASVLEGMHSTKGRLLALMIIFLFVAVFTLVLMGMSPGR